MPGRLARGTEGGRESRVEARSRGLEPLLRLPGLGEEPDRPNARPMESCEVRRGGNERVLALSFPFLIRISLLFNPFSSLAF